MSSQSTSSGWDSDLLLLATAESHYMQMCYSGSQFWDNRGRILRVTDKQSIIQLRPDTDSHSFSHGGLTVSYHNFLSDTRGRGTRGEQVDLSA